MASFRIQRILLAAGADRSITPPFMASSVAVGNATADDIAVKTKLNDPSQQLLIGAGFEREFRLPRTSYTDGIDGLGPCFWLNAVQTGEAVLIWYP